MAEPRNKTPQTNADPRRRSSYLLACFGVFGDGKLPSKKSSSRKSKSSSSLSWPIFRLSSKKSRSKTVPVDNTGKADAVDCKIRKSKKKSHSKPDYQSRSPLPPVSKHKPSRQNSKADQAPTEKPKETRHGTEPENIYLGNRKLLDLTRTGSSQPGSPNLKAKPKIHAAKLTHTVSLPALEGNTRVRNLPVHARINLKELRPKNNVGFVEILDPVIGLSIIMVTLMIMLIWGRLCAILCTSAWFYFIPRFRTTEDNRNINNSNNSMNSDQYLDLNSEEYKKKIVLKGLLERNHRFR